MHVGVLRRQRLLHRLDVLAQPLDEGAPIVAEPLLETPAAEAEQSRLRHLADHHVVGLEVEDERVSIERGPLLRRAAELEAAAGAEVVVGLELVGLVGRLLRLGGGQRPRPDDVVLLLDLALFEQHTNQQLLERSRELVRFGRRAAARDHLLPVFQVRVEGRLALEEGEPSVEELVIELLLLDDLGLLLLRLTGHLPCGLHVLRGLERERAGQLVAFGAGVVADHLLLAIQLLFLLLPLRDDRLRGERILVVLGVEEHAAERVIVLGRNRVVLVIVAPGAADRQAQHAAAHGIDAVVALVGAGNLHRPVVVVPRPESEKTEGRELSHALVLGQLIGCELSGDEAIERHVVVEGANHPVAIQVRVRIGVVAAAVGIEAPIVVLAEPGDVEPHAPPRLTVGRRLEQAIDDLRDCLRRVVLQERIHFFGCRRHAGQIDGRAAEQRQLVRRLHRLQAFFLQASENESIDVGLRPGRAGRRRNVVACQRLERPECPLLGRDDLFADRRRCGGRRLRGPGPDRAAANPRRDRLDIVHRQLRATPRHSRIPVGVLQHLEQGALVGIAWHDCGTGVTALQQRVT